MRSTFSFSFARTKLLGGFAALFALFFANLLLSVEEKKLAIFASGKTYSVAVVDSEKTEYAALSEVLQPLGRMTLRAEGRTLHIKVNGTDGEFSEGRKLVRIGEAQILLPAKPIVDQGRMLVPVRSLPRIIKLYLGQDADLHEQGRRLFVGPISEPFTIEIKRPDNSLLLTFPAAVSPRIAGENGRIHLTFDRDPVIFGADSLVYNDKVITAASFSEHDGAAEIVVSGTTPLVANLRDGGKAISVSAAPVAASPSPAPVEQQAAPAVAQPPTPAPSNAAPLTPARGVQPAILNASVPFFVMIDPSHGGDESGARFSDKLLEKDITLAIARRLRTELHNRGVTAVLLRDSDATVSYDQRAVTTNAQRAAIYVSVHAGIPGTGVRIYTALLPSSADPVKTKKLPGPFIPWEQAQRAHIDDSRVLAGAIVNEMTSAKIRSATAGAPLLPLNSINAPAISIELAPSDINAKPESMTLPKYQQAIVSAVAAGIVNARPKLETRP